MNSNQEILGFARAHDRREKRKEAATIVASILALIWVSPVLCIIGFILWAAIS